MTVLPARLPESPSSQPGFSTVRYEAAASARERPPEVQWMYRLVWLSRLVEIVIICNNTCDVSLIVNHEAALTFLPT